MGTDLMCTGLNGIQRGAAMTVTLFIKADIKAEKAGGMAWHGMVWHGGGL